MVSLARCIFYNIKSMSKVVVRIARIAIFSTFYIEFVFSELESILAPKKYISYKNIFEIFDFFSEKTKRIDL